MTSPHLTDDEILARAKAAAAESEYRALEEAFENVRQGLFHTIQSSGLGESALREKCYHVLFAIESAKAVLISMAAGAAIADNNAFIRAILNGKDPA